jgi:hypothetical protein
VLAEGCRDNRGASLVEVFRWNGLSEEKGERMASAMGPGSLSFFPFCTGGGAAQAGEMERRVIECAPGGEGEGQKVREGLRKGIESRIFPIVRLI